MPTTFTRNHAIGQSQGRKDGAGPFHPPRKRVVAIAATVTGARSRASS